MIALCEALRGRAAAVVSIEPGQLLITELPAPVRRGNHQADHDRLDQFLTRTRDVLHALPERPKQVDHAVTTDLDIRRSAQVLISRYGEDAALEAAGRADDMLDQGNFDGERIWLRILEKINELQKVLPSQGEPIHSGTL